MDEHRGSTDHRQEATRYEIRLKGHLDSRWADWLDGMSLTHAGDGTTVVEDSVLVENTAGTGRYLKRTLRSRNGS